MQCRNCGTDIADKALICYRCGAATVEAKYKPYQPPPTRSRRRVLAGATVLVLLALVLYFLLHSTP